MLTITDLVKSFADDQNRRRGKRDAGDGPKRVRAVDGISIDVAEGEFFTLLGPSGCGKTTTLRSVAGLEDPDSGRIEVGGRLLFSAGESARRVNVPANKRGLGMVFQSYAIWPHMSVFENAAFPLRVQSGGDRKDIRPRVLKVLETMELAHLADRPATKLSGGQQQRLALARAIVTEPPLLLLDEPLSNLDAKLRESLRFEIKRLQHELGITTLYVTHDQSEALAMSTQIAVMNAGSIVQLGTPREIYETPATTFVAQFIGASNLLPGTASVGKGGVVVTTAIGDFTSSRPSTASTGDLVRVSVRPETIELAPGNAPAGANRVAGRVVTSSYVGDSVITVVQVGETELRVRLKPTDVSEPGDDVVLTLPADQITVLPDDVAIAAREAASVPA
jgi:iron(III) transport system ATP-binding protein